MSTIIRMRISYLPTNITIIERRSPLWARLSECIVFPANGSILAKKYTRPTHAQANQQSASMVIFDELMKGRSSRQPTKVTNLFLDVRLLLLLAPMLALLALPCLCSYAWAEGKDPSFVAFNDGSTIQGFDWWDSDELALFAVNPHGAILWLHKIDTGERRKLISATELNELLRVRPSWEEVDFSPSPHRRYVALYGPEVAPLQASTFKVVDLSRGKAVPVSFSRIPDDFFIGGFSWDNTDKYIYVFAKEFLAPDNEVSIGRLSLETGSFMGLTRKADVDLIERLLYSPSDNSLVIVSRSFNGEYPRNQFLLSLDLAENKLVKILSAYQFRGIQVTQSGEILVAVANPMKIETDVFPGFLLSPPFLPIPETPEEGKRERITTKIVLIDKAKLSADFTLTEGPSLSEDSSGATVLLTDQSRGFDYNPYLSPNGDFLLFLRAFYRLPLAVKVRLPEQESFLFLRMREKPDKAETSSTPQGTRNFTSWGPEAQEFMVMQGADEYKVSPDERYVAVRYYDGTYLRIFELPH